RLKVDIPEGMEMNIAIDNTAFVKQSVLEVVETLIIAVILVVLIIFLFTLRSADSEFGSQAGEDDCR
ncbi:MAG TPA: efflux RND transporter permease subunit, partial [Comamonas sp.]